MNAACPEKRFFESNFSPAACMTQAAGADTSAPMIIQRSLLMSPPETAEFALDSFVAGFIHARATTKRENSQREHDPINLTKLEVCSSRQEFNWTFTRCSRHAAQVAGARGIGPRTPTWHENPAPC